MQAVGGEKGMPEFLAKILSINNLTFNECKYFFDNTFCLLKEEPAPLLEKRFYVLSLEEGVGPGGLLQLLHQAVINEIILVG